MAWRGFAFGGKQAALLMCLALLGGPVGAADWRERLPEARLVGAGDFHWYGLRVYSARLFSPVARPDLTQPFVLELTYWRSLSRDTLVDASLEEMRRLAPRPPDDAQLAAWAGLMRSAFVDVRQGQRISGLYLPGMGCRFYIDGRLQRVVDDPQFARAFFAIWLDARTRKPELRRELLGLAGPGIAAGEQP